MVNNLHYFIPSRSSLDTLTTIICIPCLLYSASLSRKENVKIKIREMSGLKKVVVLNVAVLALLLAVSASADMVDFFKPLNSKHQEFAGTCTYNTLL